MDLKNKEPLVSLETAILAKEKGFDWSVQYYFQSFRGQKPHEFGKKYKNDLPGSIYYIVGETNYNKSPSGSDDETWSRPTQSLLQKWLREVHNIHIQIEISNIGRYFFQIYHFEPKNKSNVLFFISQEVGKFKYATYEEALEVGLQEALKLISK